MPGTSPARGTSPAAKFSKRIFDAMIQSGGWTNKDIFKRDPVKMVVLSGEMTGTWTLHKPGDGRVFFKWTPVLSHTLRYTQAVEHLIAWRSFRIKEVTGPHQDPWTHGMLELAERSGEWFHAAIAEEPRRRELIIEAFSMASRMRHFDERKRFMMDFWRTWSVRKAMPPWVKKCFGWRRVVQRPQDLWLLRILRNMDHVDHALQQGFTYLWISSLNMVPRKHWREILAVVREQDLRYTLMVDAIRMGNPELREARRWRRLYDEHQEHNARGIGFWPERGVTEEDKERFNAHHIASPIVPHPAITALQTRENLTKEGEEMKHCVGNYWAQTQSWIYSIRNDDGRSTVSVYRHGGIEQHYSERNSDPPESHKALLTYITDAVKIRLNEPRTRVVSGYEALTIDQCPF